MKKLKDMAGAFQKKTAGFENIFKLATNVFFLMVIILYSMKKIAAKNLLESVA